MDGDRTRRARRAKSDPHVVRSTATELVHQILVERNRLAANGSLVAEYDAHVRRLCDVLAWRHSEAFGKYEGCPRWTKAARASFVRFGRRVTSVQLAGDDALRHEHAYPRKELVDGLFALVAPTPNEVAGFLESHNIGVVVTAEEARRLDEHAGTRDDPFLRYRLAAVELEETSEDTDR